MWHRATPPPPPPPPQWPPYALPTLLAGLSTLLLAVLAVHAALRALRRALHAQRLACEASVASLRRELRLLEAAADHAPPPPPPAPTSPPPAPETVEAVPRSPRKPQIRIWMDGAFDMMHYGHVNAFRQGRALGTHLVVGVNDDASITRCKGAPPVMNDAERLAMIAACRFVDEVAPAVPYVMDEAYLRWVIQRYDIDFVVHGDDPCIVDGKDVYASAQALGKYRTIPRTEGVSTTEIVGRMLLLTSEHHTSSSHASPLLGAAAEADGRKLTQVLHSFSLGGEAAPRGGSSGFVRESKFMTTSQMLRLFAAGCATPPPGARVVYVDGGWDMFHAGHANFLKAASELGDFLYVGIHNDVVVNSHRGSNFPIMNLNERVLSVLACRYTGDVVIDPPWHMTREMIAALNISVVAHGTVADANDDESDPYEVPKKLGIYREIDSTMPQLTVDNIVSRIQANHEKMKAKVTKKMASEREYYSSRYGFEAS